MKELSTKLENIVKLFKYKNNEDQVVKEFKNLSDYLKKQEKNKFTAEEIKKHLYNVEVINNFISPQIIVALEKHRGKMTETEYKEMWHILISFLYTFEDVNTDYIETGAIRKAWFGFIRTWTEESAVPVYFKLEGAKRGSYAKNISEAEKKELNTKQFKILTYNVSNVGDKDKASIQEYIEENKQISIYRYNKNSYLMLQHTYEGLLDKYPTDGIAEFSK